MLRKRPLGLDAGISVPLRTSVGTQTALPATRALAPICRPSSRRTLEVRLSTGDARLFKRSSPKFIGMQAVLRLRNSDPRSVLHGVRSVCQDTLARFRSRARKRLERRRFPGPAQLSGFRSAYSMQCRWFHLPSSSEFDHCSCRSVGGAARRLRRALLHKSCDTRGSSFPRRIHPTASETGMPRAV